MSGNAATERGIIEELKRVFRSPPPPQGIGDDCAVLKIGREVVLVSTDILSERTHFPAFMSFEQRGRMAAAANLSDIAAMGGRPLALVVSMGIPEGMSVAQIRSVARGIRVCASEYGAEIVGGDTKRAAELTISITAIGRKTGRVLLRSAARPGQLLCVTGHLGGAAADFLDWKKGKTPGPGSKLTSPTPRIKEGMALSSRGIAHAAIDITDGLALSAWYISRASGVGIEMVMESIPVSTSLAETADTDALLAECLFYWGGDYELLFTARSAASVMRLSEELGTPMSIIGKVTEGGGVRLRTESGMTRLEERGFDAFAEGSIGSAAH